MIDQAAYPFLALIVMLLVVIWLGNTKDNPKENERKNKSKQRKKETIEVDGFIYEKVGKKQPKRDRMGRLIG